MSTKNSYRVRGIDLDYDEKRYPEGSKIELDDEAAAKLKRFLEPTDDTAAAEKAAAEKAEAEKAAAEKAEAEKSSSKGGKK